jgi:hypothetical protein
MDGWMVMAAPLEVLMRLAAPLAGLWGARWLWRRVRREGFGLDGAVHDDDVIATYLLVIDAGWAPRAASTFAEVAVRLGTNIPHVRQVIGREDFAV